MERFAPKLNMPERQSVPLPTQSSIIILENQHSIAERVEAIPFGDGSLVGTPDQITPTEGADQHQQARFRQVEIGQQDVHNTEAEAGVNK